MCGAQVTTCSCYYYYYHVSWQCRWWQLLFHSRQGVAGREGAGIKTYSHISIAAPVFCWTSAAPCGNCGSLATSVLPPPPPSPPSPPPSVGGLATLLFTHVRWSQFLQRLGEDYLANHGCSKLYRASWIIKNIQVIQVFLAN